MNKISNSEQYVSSKVYLAGDIVVKVGNKVYKANCWTKKKDTDPSKEHDLGTPWSLLEDKESSGLPDKY
jgi:hypothetical protein